MEFALQTLVNALTISSIYMLMAVGFTLVFGVMQVANLAHGELYMLGAYTVWLLYARNDWPFLAAVAAAFIVVGVFGLIAERTLFRRFRGNMLGGAIASVGLIFILQVLAGQIWGVGQPKAVSAAYPGALSLFGLATLPWQRLVIIPTTFLTLWLLWVFLSRFRLGRALRACAQDWEAASLQGISANTSGAIALCLGFGLAGLAGALMAPIVAIHPYMGHMPLMIALIVIVVGGPGSIKGAIIVSVLFGFVYTILTTLLDSTIANISSVVLMVVLLAIRPGGLVSHAEA